MNYRLEAQAGWFFCARMHRASSNMPASSSVRILEDIPLTANFVFVQTLSFDALPGSFTLTGSNAIMFSGLQDLYFNAEPGSFLLSGIIAYMGVIKPCEPIGIEVIKPFLPVAIESLTPYELIDIEAATFEPVNIAVSSCTTIPVVLQKREIIKINVSRPCEN